MIARLLPTAWRQSAYRRRFLSNTGDNLFMGAFDSFEAARAAAPASMHVGYDTPETADHYSPQLTDFDYPALFWVGRAVEQGMRSVFDLGGHVGIKYYAFRRVRPFPDDLRWTVCDVPAVVEAGRAGAQTRGVTQQLDFCTDWREMDGCDVLLASGSLQYLPLTLGEMLASLTHKPRRIVLNTTAVHPQRTIYTLNSIVVAVCPYRIQHLDELNRQLTDAGYRRLDHWRNTGKPIEVPFVPGGDAPFYAGACWDRR